MTTHKQLRRDLAKAVTYGAEAVIKTCREAVAYWNLTYWPDDWSDWQRALWDYTDYVSIDEV